MRGSLACIAAAVLATSACAALPAATRAPAASPTAAITVVTPARPTATRVATETPAVTGATVMASPGARTLGDSLFPTLGNGGIDVQSYYLDCEIDPERSMQAAVTIVITTTQDLSEFSLDFQQNAISEVLLEGVPVSYLQEEDKLVVIPAYPLLNGSTVELIVRYGGPLPTSVDTVFAAKLGWQATEDGGGIFMSEPNAAHVWFPCNDHPRDKALYSFRVTVPKPWVAVANGLQQGITDGGATRTYEYAARDPMATYVATIAVGNFRSVTHEGPDGLPITDYLDTGIGSAARANIDRAPATIEALSAYFGPYPFEAFGYLVLPLGEFSGGMEFQTLPALTVATAQDTRQRVMEHEVAHQWFGDAVTLSDWRFTWIKEGMAEYMGSFVSTEYRDGNTIDATNNIARAIYARLLGGIALVPEPRAMANILPVMGKYGVDIGRLYDRAAVIAAARSALDGRMDATILAQTLAQVPAEGMTGSDFIYWLGTVPPEPVYLSRLQATTMGFLLSARALDGIESYRRFFADGEPLLVPPGRIDPTTAYSASAYEVGALIYHHLRLTVGDDVFRQITREFVRRYQGGAAGADELVAVASEVSGHDLRPFFDAWLYTEPLNDIPELGLYAATFTE
ncbi:MAG: M1 family metallopeptidase [Anaerolineae bacterium]